MWFILAEHIVGHGHEAYVLLLVPGGEEAAGEVVGRVGALVEPYWEDDLRAGVTLLAEEGKVVRLKAVAETHHLVGSIGSILPSLIVEIDAAEYELVKNSVILLEQIRTIDKRRLKEKICHLDDNLMEQVDKGIKISFALNT